MKYTVTNKQLQKIINDVTAALEDGRRVEFVPLKDCVRIFVAPKERTEIKY